MKKRLVALSFLLVSVAASGVAVAAPASKTMSQQSAPSASQAAAQQRAALPKSSDFSDDQVATFAKAHVKVQAIKSSYLKKLKAASKDPKAAQSVQQEAQKKMVQAVKDDGLSVETYNKMAYTTQHDADLRKRVKQAQ